MQKSQYSNELSQWADDLSPTIQLYAPHNGALGTYSFSSWALHFLYFTIVIILRHPIPDGCDVTALKASSYIAGLCDHFLARGDIQTLPPSANFGLLAAAIVQLSMLPDREAWKLVRRDHDLVRQALSERAGSAQAAKEALRWVDSAKQSFQNRPQKRITIYDSGDMLLSFGTDLCSINSFVELRKAGLDAANMTPLNGGSAQSISSGAEVASPPQIELDNGLFWNDSWQSQGNVVAEMLGFDLALADGISGDWMGPETTM